MNGAEQDRTGQDGTTHDILLYTGSFNKNSI